MNMADVLSHMVFVQTVWYSLMFRFLMCSTLLMPPSKQATPRCVNLTFSRLRMWRIASTNICWICRCLYALECRCLSVFAARCVNYSRTVSSFQHSTPTLGHCVCVVYVYSQSSSPAFKAALSGSHGVWNLFAFSSNNNNGAIIDHLRMYRMRCVFVYKCRRSVCRSMEYRCTYPWCGFSLN